jgi:peptide/nickel transport system substrate-binding protein
MKSVTMRLLIGLLLSTMLCAGALATELVVALGGDTEGWDPATVIYYAAGEIVRNCYDSLITYEIMPAEESPYGVAMLDVSKPTGMLARSWDVSADGKVYTFYLRDDVVFASGNRLTAEDVRWTVERGLAIPGGISWLWDVMGVTSLNQVEVVDDLTIRFRLDAPNSLFLPSLELEVMAIVDSTALKAVATAEDPYAHNYLYTRTAGSGPYVVDSFTAGSEIVLKARDNYWGGTPGVNRVVYKIIPSEATRILLLKSGDADISLFISPEQVQNQLLNQRGINVVSIPTPGTEYLALNTDVEPLNNVLVRKALAYATPYDDLLDNVMFGFGARASSPVPTLTNMHRSVSPYVYDPALAKELLTLAGYPDGLELTLSYRLDNPVEEAVAIYLKDAYAEIGVDLTIDKVAASRFEVIRGTREYEMALIYWTPYVNDPVYQLSFNYASFSDCCNYGEFNIPEYDQLIRAATRATDPVKQEGLVNAMQQLIIDNSPIIYLYHPNRITSMRDDVEGFVYNSAHFLRFFYMGKSE